LFLLQLHQWTVTGIHGSVLDLSARLEVAIDVSHAITYLHMYIGTIQLSAHHAILSWQSV